MIWKDFFGCNWSQGKLKKSSADSWRPMSPKPIDHWWYAHSWGRLMSKNVVWGTLGWISIQEYTWCWPAGEILRKNKVQVRNTLSFDSDVISLCSYTSTCKTFLSSPREMGSSTSLLVCLVGPLRYHKLHSPTGTKKALCGFSVCINCAWIHEPTYCLCCTKKNGWRCRLDQIISGTVTA